VIDQDIVSNRKEISMKTDDEKRKERRTKTNVFA